VEDNKEGGSAPQRETDLTDRNARARTLLLVPGLQGWSIVELAGASTTRVSA